MIQSNKNQKNKHDSDQQEPKEQAWFRPTRTKRTSMIQTNKDQKNKHDSDQQEKNRHDSEQQQDDSEQQEPKEHAWFRPTRTKRTSMIQTNKNQKNKQDSDLQ